MSRLRAGSAPGLAQANTALSWTLRILIALLPLTGGCVSFTAPPALQADAAGATRLRQLEIQVRYEFARRQPSGELMPAAHVQRCFVELLRDLELFAEVRMAGSAELRTRPADLVIRGMRGDDRFNGLPLIPCLTAGIVPIWGADNPGYCFEIASPAPGADTLPALAGHGSYDGTCIVGWIGGLAGLWPGRMWFRPDSTAGYRRWLRALLTIKAREIEELVLAGRSQRQTPDE